MNHIDSSATRLVVTGGAGYIGSHFSTLAVRQGYVVHVVDDLRTGFSDALVPDVRFHRLALHEKDKLGDLLATIRPNAVVHFAGSISVGESVVKPTDYYENNVLASLVLLRAMHAAGLRNFIFSSSAAVYGAPPVAAPIVESQVKAPMNPYGHSKWMVEQILSDASKAGELRYCALRYFNAAGASSDGSNGERHQPETHLIPLAIHATICGSPLTVFGNDYPTQDGTCIRDYVHVNDLARAHLKAVEYLLADGDSVALNLGTSQGTSVLEVVRAVSAITKREVPLVWAPRRAGDPAFLVADATAARATLDWVPIESGLDAIVTDAIRWESKRMSGQLLPDQLSVR